MSKIINNLKEFLEFRGFSIEDGPYRWARCFYKYTDCGPWSKFLMEGEPARDEQFSFLVVRRGGKLFAARNGDAPFPPGDLLEPLGFLQDGTAAKGYSPYLKSFGAYSKALARLGGSYGDSRNPVKLQFWDGPTDPKPGERRWIMVSVEHHVPAVVREAYYEDKAINDVTNDNCIGLEIGSIVEGSDVCWGPEEFIFPFAGDDFDKAIENMEAETRFYWERDNSQWYKVQTPRGEYYLHNTWGDVVWDGQKPAKALREKIEAFIHEHFDEIVHEVRAWHLEVKPDWKPTPIPGTRSTIHEYCNDYTF